MSGDRFAACVLPGDSRVCRRLSGVPRTARSRQLASYWIVPFVCFAAACSDGITSPLGYSAQHPSDLSQEWTLTPPASQGVDSAALAEGFSAASLVPGLTSLLVVRHSRLVGEWYASGGRSDSLYAARSVTKSVMSLLVGIAIHQGRLGGTDTPLSAYWRPTLPSLTAAKGAITIHDLLTMTSGFQWDEDGNVAQYNDWVSAPDEIAYLVDRPLVCAPGKCWNYNSAAVHLLSLILSDAIPAGVAAFADSTLFTPLGFHPVMWEIFPDGLPNGGAGLYLRPRDMAKIGALVLQQGVSGNTAVVPATWIREATQRQLKTVDGLRSTGLLDYGELWWVGHAGGHPVVVAWGYGGQYIWIVPDLDLVIVATATWQATGGAAPFDANAIADLLVTQIMPTAKGN